MTDREQFQALNVLDYLSDLFTAAKKETFTRVEILVLLDNTKNDPDLFDPAVRTAQQIATVEIDSHSP
jgi:hypothetical protein